MHGNFTWTDLSTLDVAEAKRFYSAIFQWDFTEDDSGYVDCTKSATPCSGLYEMPQLFRKIRMPSFWMTYISVSDIDVVVMKAKELGGRVELEETNSLGKIALIRDPAGAGFTCYEGVARSAIEKNPGQGRWGWSELFTSDFAQINNFYAELFGWVFEESGDIADRYLIRNEGGEAIGAVQVSGNAIKGEKEFWGVFFGVDDAGKTLSGIRDAGGKVIYDYSNSNGVHYLVNDSQGAVFFVTGQDSATDEVEPVTKLSSKRMNLKWRSLLGLVLVYLAIAFEADWLWSVLFLFWVIPDLKSGTTYFIEPLTRIENPVLYWAVVLTWIGLSGFLLISAI